MNKLEFLAEALFPKYTGAANPRSSSRLSLEDDDKKGKKVPHLRGSIGKSPVKTGSGDTKASCWRSPEEVFI